MIIDKFIKEMTFDSILRPNFEGAIKRCYGFEQGDVFEVPTDMKVFLDKESNNCFTLVETDKGKVRKLYPSQFTRRIETTDGKVVYASGTVVDFYKSFGFVNDAMNALKGRKICISQVTYVETMCFGRCITKKVYTFDFV